MTSRLAKILFFDIETTHLKADFGTLLCTGFKWLGDSKVYVPCIADRPKWTRDPTNDRAVVLETYKIMASADMWVSYFGKGFDVKYINAKLLEHGLPVLPNIPHVDLFYTVKSNLALSRKSLQNVAYFLKLRTEKSPVEGRIWKRAMVGHAPSLRYIIRHCRADVLVLEEAYLRLRSLVRTHPRVDGFGPCRYCGGTRLQKRGTVINALKNRKQRIVCAECGGWDQRDITKVKRGSAR